MVSWASFWIHEEAVPARAAICVTTILTIITMLGVVNVNMPKVSYVKAVDFYLFISFLMVFLSLVEYIIVLNIETFCRNRKQRKRYREIGNDKVGFFSFITLISIYCWGWKYGNDRPEFTAAKRQNEAVKFL